MLGWGGGCWGTTFILIAKGARFVQDIKCTTCFKIPAFLVASMNRTNATVCPWVQLIGTITLCKLAMRYSTTCVYNHFYWSQKTFIAAYTSIRRLNNLMFDLIGSIHFLEKYSILGTALGYRYNSLSYLKYTLLLLKGQNLPLTNSVFICFIVNNAFAIMHINYFTVKRKVNFSTPFLY